MVYGGSVHTQPAGILSAVPGALPAPVRLFVSAIRVRVIWPRSGAIEARFALLEKGRNAFFPVG